MEKLVVWFFKSVMKRRVIETFDSNGKRKIRSLQVDESGRAWISTGAMLDNAKQTKGEFRKSINSKGLVRWANL